MTRINLTILKLRVFAILKSYFYNTFVSIFKSACLNDNTNDNIDYLNSKVHYLLM